jgi:hypothetical protein
MFIASGLMFAAGVVAFVYGMVRAGRDESRQHNVLSGEVIGLALMLGSLYALAVYLFIDVLAHR